jgi:hypothetical protein
LDTGRCGANNRDGAIDILGREKSAAPAFSSLVASIDGSTLRNRTCSRIGSSIDTSSRIYMDAVVSLSASGFIAAPPAGVLTGKEHD